MCVALNAAGVKKPSHYSDLKLRLFSRDDHYLQEKQTNIKNKIYLPGDEKAARFCFKFSLHLKISVISVGIY